MRTAVESTLSTLRHSAIVYRGPEDYRRVVLGFVDEGLREGRPALVAVPGSQLAVLRDGLAPQVRTLDMAVAGRNPGRIIGEVLSAFAREHRGRRVCIVGEPIWVGRTAAEYPACAEHEALINVALADSLVDVMCPYDAALDPAVLDDATRTHPVLGDGTAEWPSPTYLDPVLCAATFDRPLPAPPPEAEFLIVSTRTGPGEARRFTHDVAVRECMAAPRRSRLLVAVQELAVNTIVHSGGPGLCSVWAEGSHLVVQFDDGGHLDDPLVGRRHRDASAAGYGLAAVHRVCDLVRVHRRGDGTTVRIHVGLH